MKNSSGAGLLSVLVIMSIIFATPARAERINPEGSQGHMSMISPRHHATISQHKVGNKNFQVAQVVINSAPELVWEALTQYDRADEIYSNLKRLQVLNDNGPQKTISFTVASMGGLWKYDYVLNISELKALKRIEWTRHSGAFKANEGYWQLTPVEGDKTLVTYAKHIDGGILLPQAMVNSELRKIMPEVLNNLRSAVMKEHIALSSK
jgi:uncharacterized membrane protein